MKTLKTWEVYRMALENQEDKFKRLRESNEIYVLRNGFIRPSSEKNEYSSIDIGEHWKLIQDPVDFMTAANSGKLFKPESWVWNTDNQFRNLYDNLQMFSGRGHIQLQILNGKWYIE